MTVRTTAPQNRGAPWPDPAQNVIFNTQARFMCALTPELTVREASPFFLSAYGLPPHQAADLRFAELIWPEHAAQVESNLRALTPERKIMTFEQDRSEAPSLPRRQQWTIMADFDPQGRVAAYQAYSQDISAWKLSEVNLIESELQYRSVVEDQCELLCRYKPDWPKCTILFANDAYCRAHGTKREDLIGNSFMSTLSKDDRNRIHKFIETATPQDPVQFFTQHITRANGEDLWVEWHRRALFDSSGSLYAIQGVGRDVTELRRTELALVEKNAELERKNAALTEVLEHIEQKKRGNKGQYPGQHP